MDNGVRENKRSQSVPPSPDRHKSKRLFQKTRDPNLPPELANRRRGREAGETSSSSLRPRMCGLCMRLEFNLHSSPPKGITPVGGLKCWSSCSEMCVSTSSVYKKESSSRNLSAQARSTPFTRPPQRMGSMVPRFGYRVRCHTDLYRAWLSHLGW